MQKFPFTNKGFQDLQISFSVQTDQQLQAAATRLRFEFKSWMPEYFELTEAQMMFLLFLEEKTVSFIAFEASYALENRLPITLNKADPPANGEIDKIIWTRSSLRAKEGSSFGFTASGELEINISYQL